MLGLFHPLICSIGSSATSFNGLLTARMIGIFCGGVSDATGPSFVGDVFYLHERGRSMMVFNICLSAALFIGPFFCSWITYAAGWRWTVGFLALAVFTNLLAMIFFLSRVGLSARLYQQGTLYNAYISRVAQYYTWLLARGKHVQSSLRNRKACSLSTNPMGYLHYWHRFRQRRHRANYCNSISSPKSRIALTRAKSDLFKSLLFSVHSLATFSVEHLLITSRLSLRGAMFICRAKIRH